VVERSVGIKEIFFQKSKGRGFNSRRLHQKNKRLIIYARKEEIKMPFEPELDKELARKDIEFTDRNTRIVVAIKQYNEGEKKIQIGRENLRAENWQFAKLGRLTKEEAEKLIPAIKEIIEQM
jgi:hypothetical protein